MPLSNALIDFVSSYQIFAKLHEYVIAPCAIQASKFWGCLAVTVAMVVL